jgi:hypothetical protein
MYPKTFTALLLALALLGAAIGHPAQAVAGSMADGRSDPAPADSLPAGARPPAARPPLLLDLADLGLGATVVYSRIPSAAEIHDLVYLESVTRVVLQLPAWPDGVEEIQPLEQMALPEGADLFVLLPGYPATREQAGAWNLLRRRVRLIMVVNTPPADREMVFRMNSIRGLERVIADVDRPSRTGFERLQRPLAFRVVMP